jgi:hypothetical protein
MSIDEHLMMAGPRKGVHDVDLPPCVTDRRDRRSFVGAFADDRFEGVHSRLDLDQDDR